MNNSRGRKVQVGDEAGPAAGETLFDWPRQTGRLEMVMTAIQEREERLRLRRRRRGWAAGVLIVGLSAGWVAYDRPVSAPGPSRAERNVAKVVAADEKTLPDGSVAELKAGADVKVHYTAAERRIVLRQGEAHFNVVKDHDRVFVVEAGGVEFRAVGTAFAVQLHAKGVGMIVTEGRVAVARTDQGEESADKTPSLTIVEAGSRAEWEIAGPGVLAPTVQVMTAQEMSEKLAWRVPRLELNETPLAEVVAELNRYSPIRLKIGEPALEKVAISGILRADNVAPLLRVLKINYGIAAQEIDAETIVLRAGNRD